MSMQIAPTSTENYNTYQKLQKGIKWINPHRQHASANTDLILPNISCKPQKIQGFEHQINIPYNFSHLFFPSKFLFA